MTNIIPFKTSKVEGLFVLLHEGAFDIVIDDNELHYYHKDSEGKTHFEYFSFDRKYIFLCRLNEASEEQARLIMLSKSVLTIVPETRETWEKTYYFMEKEKLTDDDLFTDARYPLLIFAKSLGAKDNDLILIKK